ncbi:MAG: hypothetical protein ABI873_02430 [Marmoricola sp.]
MTSNEPHRRRVTVKRRRRHQAEVSAGEQAAQERARVQREINRQLRTWTPGRIIAWALVGLGLVVGVNHMFMHLGGQWLPMSQGLQDVLVGYPTAGLLAVAGFVILGQKPSGTTR